MQTQKAALVASLHELIDERGGGGERNAETALASRQAKRQGHMGLADAARPKGYDILAAHHVFAASQFEGQHLVERRDRRKFEAVEALDRREARGPDAALHHAPLPGNQLQLRQT